MCMQKCSLSSQPDFALFNSIIDLLIKNNSIVFFWTRHVCNRSVEQNKIALPQHVYRRTLKKTISLFCRSIEFHDKLNSATSATLKSDRFDWNSLFPVSILQKLKFKNVFYLQVQLTDHIYSTIVFQQFINLFNKNWNCYIGIKKEIGIILKNNFFRILKTFYTVRKTGLPCFNHEV